MKRLTCVLLGCVLFCHSFCQKLTEAQPNVVNDASKPAADVSKTVNRFTSKQMVVPSFFIAAGIAASAKWPGKSIDRKVCDMRNKNNPHFSNKIDDYIQFSPVALTYAFDAFGMKCKTDILNRTVIGLKSHLLMTTIVTSAKMIFNTKRPDFSANNSFPSGHTAQAFVAASFMSEELGHKYKWVPYLAYSLATSVGTLRVMNNKHYVSDVLVGAGVGILATKLVYSTHKYKWGNGNKKKLKTIHS
jgi:membrane-associated phospholipid phosphatase